MSTPGIRVSYTLVDKAHCFDVAQGIHAERSYILRLGGGKARPYTACLRKMLCQSALFFLLAAVQLILLVVGGVSTLRLLILVLCALFGAVVLYAYLSGKGSYARSYAWFLERNDKGGTLSFDERGITMHTDTGYVLDFHWSEYQACVIGGGVIVVLSTRPMLMIAEWTEATEREIRGALCAFERGNTVCTVEVREKKK